MERMASRYSYYSIFMGRSNGQTITGWTCTVRRPNILGGNPWRHFSPNEPHSPSACPKSITAVAAYPSKSFGWPPRQPLRTSAAAPSLSLLPRPTHLYRRDAAGEHAVDLRPAKGTEYFLHLPTSGHRVVFIDCQFSPAVGVGTSTVNHSSPPHKFKF